MKVIFHGNGIVWDPDRQRPLCEFKDGVVALDDERAIAVMRLNGFAEDVLPVEEPVPLMVDDVRIVSSVEIYPPVETVSEPVSEDEGLKPYEPKKRKPKKEAAE